MLYTMSITVISNQLTKEEGYEKVFSSIYIRMLDINSAEL